MNTLKKNGEFQNIYNLGNKYFGNYSLIREYIRLNIDKINDNYDIIIVAKKKFGENIEDLKYKDIEKDLNRIFKNSKII